VDFLERSNMKKMATASLHTSGSILKNSRCPPKSHILKVISVFLKRMVFSRKFTPAWMTKTMDNDETFSAEKEVKYV